MCVCQIHTRSCKLVYARTSQTQFSWSPRRLNFVQWLITFPAATIAAFLPLTYKRVHQFTCTELKGTDNSEVQESPQNCESSVLNLFQVILLRSSSSSSSHFCPTFIFLSITSFRRNFLRKIWPIQLVFLHFIVRRIFLSYLTPCNTYIYHTINPNDLMHPSPAPYFKTFPVFLIYFSKRPSFSTTQSYALNVTLY